MLMRSLSAGLLAVSVLSGLAVRPAAAQEGWEPVGPPGGVVQDLVLHPGDSRILWAGTDGGGVFKSLDGGDSWTPANQGLSDLRITALAVAPGDPDTLYAAAGVLPTAAGVFRSTDGGETWTPASRGLPSPPPFCGCGSLDLVTDLAVHPRQPEVVYAAAGGGLYKTGTGGRRWGPLPAGATVSAVAIDPVRPATVWAGVEGGVRKSADGGSSWSAASPQLGQTPIEALLIDLENPQRVWAAGRGGLFRTTNGGARWQPPASGLTDRRVLSLALAPASGRGGTAVWAGTVTGTFRSADGGATWSRASQGQRNRSVAALAADPRRPGTLWAGSGALTRTGLGIFKTANHGATWRVSSRGLFALPTRALAFDPVTPGVVWVGTGGLGVFHSSDRGETWEARNTGISPLTISSLAVDPNDPQTVWAASAGRNVYVTHDEGAHWEPRGAGLVDPVSGFTPLIQVLRLDPRDSAVVYAGTWSGLFRTADAGGHWTRIGPIAGSVSVTDLFIDPRDPDVIFAAAGELWVTRDGGAGWERVAVAQALAGITAIAADPRNPDVLFAGGQDGVFRSADGGLTWQRSAGDPVLRVASLSAGSTGEVWAVTPDGAFRSPDGIDDWVRVPGLERTFPDEVAVDPHDPDTVYAATFAGVFRHQVSRSRLQRPRGWSAPGPSR